MVLRGEGRGTYLGQWLARGRDQVSFAALEAVSKLPLGPRKKAWGGSEGESLEWKAQQIGRTYLVRVRPDGSVGAQVELDVAEHDLPGDAKAGDEVLLLGRHAEPFSSYANLERWGFIFSLLFGDGRKARVSIESGDGCGMANNAEKARGKSSSCSSTQRVWEGRKSE